MRLNKNNSSNDKVLAAVVVFSEKITKEAVSLNLRVKALEERPVVLGGGDGIS